jgi:hypothetical protein
MAAIVWSQLWKLPAVVPTLGLMVPSSMRQETRGGIDLFAMVTPRHCDPHSVMRWLHGLAQASVHADAAELIVVLSIGRM